MSTHYDLRLPCPGKLNLFLHINGQRPDGYHDLQTVFQLVDTCDEVSFKRIAGRGQILFSCDRADLVGDENLVTKAALALSSQVGIEKSHQSISIHLKKRLPVGGGMGGGSSNAATTLIALNHLWQTGLSIDELARLGARLGADVPVFVQGRSAWAEGIGEKLMPLQLQAAYYLVLQPNCHISTKALFSDKNLTRHTPRIKVAAFLETGGKNDFEALVKVGFPEVKRAMAWLDKKLPAGEKAKLTGTGSCIFASFDSKHAAELVLKQLVDEQRSSPSELNGVKGFVTKGVNESPLITEFSQYFTGV